MTGEAPLPSTLLHVTPATWRSASQAPWVCLLAMYDGETISLAAIRDLSEALADSSDPVLQQLKTHNTRPGQDHLDVTANDPVLARVAGQALLTITRNGPAGKAAESALLDILQATVSAHGVRQQAISSVSELLSRTDATATYTDPVDTRARRYQIGMLVAFILLFAGMGYLLRM